MYKRCNRNPADRDTKRLKRKAKIKQIRFNNFINLKNFEQCTHESLTFENV